LTEKCLDTFWAIFSQTHLVTLAQTWQAETSSNSEGIKLLCFWRKLLGWLEICGGLLHRNPRSYARRSMFEKRRLFSGDCEGNRGFVDPWKMFLWSKLPCLGWISVQFYKVLFPPPKKIFAGPVPTYVLGLVLRFLWATHNRRSDSICSINSHVFTYRRAAKQKYWSWYDLIHTWWPDWANFRPMLSPIQRIVYFGQF
jgi:hypothetical protein